jgi:predicted Rossmann fold nucleotide-binding protein DprA/Smf involved in DNA uptake
MNAIYPNSPGYRVPGTSEDAAHAIASHAAAIKARVLSELRKAPGTPDEIAGRLNESILAVRPRLSELKARGKIEETGIRRKNASGMSAAELRAV